MKLAEALEKQTISIVGATNRSVKPGLWLFVGEVRITPYTVRLKKDAAIYLKARYFGLMMRGRWRDYLQNLCPLSILMLGSYSR
jgi:hypothetical protein